MNLQTISSICNAGSGIGDGVVEHIGKSIHGLFEIAEQLDPENDVPQLSGNTRDHL